MVGDRFCKICGAQLVHVIFCDHDPRKRNSGEMFADTGEKRSEFFLAKYDISSLDFQEKWPQRISRKLLYIFHEGRNKILSQRDSGSGRAQDYPGKIWKIVCTGDSFPIKIQGGPGTGTQISIPCMMFYGSSLDEIRISFVRYCKKSLREIQGGLGITRGTPASKTLL